MKFLLVVMTFMLPLGVNAFPNSHCGHINGLEMCAADYGPNGNDLLLVRGPQGVERVRVQCSHQFTPGNLLVLIKKKLLNP